MVDMLDMVVWALRAQAGSQGGGPAERAEQPRVERGDLGDQPGLDPQYVQLDRAELRVPGPAQ